MNLIEPTAWGAPVAEVRQAFDEERALAEIREQIARRDDATGEYKQAVFRIGDVFVKVKLAYPNIPGKTPTGAHDPRFVAFCEKAGVSVKRAMRCVSYARKPETYFADVQKQAAHIKARGGAKTIFRNQTLIEIRDALLESSREEVLEAINLELAGTFPNAQAKS